MNELFAAVYTRMTANYALLQGMLIDCPLVDLMWVLTFTLTALWLVSWGIQTLRVRHAILRAERFPTDDSKTKLLHEIADEIGLEQTPPLYKGNNRTLPVFTSGLWRPTVFIHPRLADTFDRHELRAALTHELVHVKRRDNLKNNILCFTFCLIPVSLVQLSAVDLTCDPEDLLAIAIITLIGTFMIKALIMSWYRFRRECSCDDRTVAITKDPTSLASALLRTRAFIGAATNPHQSRDASTSPLVRRSEVGRRVRRLIDYRPPIFWNTVFRLAKGFALVFGLTVCLFLWDFHVLSAHQSLEASCERLNTCTLISGCVPDRCGTE